MSMLPPPTWAPPAQKIDTPPGLWVGLVAAVAVVFSSSMPWVHVSSTFGDLQVVGIDGDGKITAALAAVGGALLWFGWTKRKPRYLLGTIVLAALAGVVALLDWSSLSDKVRELNSSDSAVRASLGLGFYITGIGAVVLFAAAFEVRSVVRSIPRARPDHE